jgi:hypothetical protein
MAALGEYDEIRKFDFSPREGKVTYGQMMITERDGILARAEVDDPDCDARFFTAAGEEVHKYEGPNDCIGQVVVTGTSKKECEERVSRILASLEII